MTKKIKVLNAYCGIGGNRKLWPDNEIEVTAIENNPQIAKIYQDNFPNDKVIVCDAHQYILEHYKEFDFIWSSVPCQTHSRARYWGISKTNPVYPDFKLFEEIVFLKHHFKGKWIVENVRPYYGQLLIKPCEVGRHYFWSNIILTKMHSIKFPKDSTKQLQKQLGFDISKYNSIGRKDRILRNCVNPKLGLYVFNCAFKEKQETLR